MFIRQLFAVLHIHSALLFILSSGLPHPNEVEQDHIPKTAEARERRNATGASAEPQSKSKHWDGPGFVGDVPPPSSKVIRKLDEKKVLFPNDPALNFSCKGSRGPFSPIGDYSKYFADNSNKYSYEQGKDACFKNKLVIADFDGTPDLFFLMGPCGSDQKYFIGLNDKKKEGVFKRAADESDIQFQFFHSSQPDDKDQGEDCVAVGKEDKDGPIGMSDEKCNASLRVLCMLPKGSECYKNSIEAILHSRAGERHEMAFMSRVDGVSFYVSSLQGTFEKASEHCRQLNMSMLSTETVIDQSFLEGLNHWEKMTFNGTLLPMNYFWLSGTLEEYLEKEGKPYSQQQAKSEAPSEISERQSTKKFKLSEMLQKRFSKTEGYLDGGSGVQQDLQKDICVAFGVERENYDPHLKYLSCSIPHYFLCMEIET